MRKSLTALVLAATVATSGCAAFKARGRAPDDFTVARSAPLVVPPDFNLAPPVTGTGGLSPSDAQQQAVDALFGGPAPRSLGEMTLLEQANRDIAPIGIRSTVGTPIRASSTRARRRSASLRRRRRTATSPPRRPDSKKDKRGYQPYKMAKS